MTTTVPTERDRSGGIVVAGIAGGVALVLAAVALTVVIMSQGGSTEVIAIAGEDRTTTTSTSTSTTEPAPGTSARAPATSESQVAITAAPPTGPPTTAAEPPPPPPPPTSTTSTQPPTTAPTPTTSPEPPPPPPAAPPARFTRFDGAAFDISYPEGWIPKTREEFDPEGDAYDTTIAELPGEISETLIRISRRPGVGDLTLDEQIGPVVASLENSSRANYVLIALDEVELPTRSGPRRALRWEYETDHADTGTRMYSVNYYFSDGDDGYALLTRAPAEGFVAYATTFDEVRQSILIG